MSRVKLVFTPKDFAGPVTGETANSLRELFDHIRPWAGDAGIPRTAAGFAIVARDPRLAMLLARLSDYMTLECPWTSERTALRELSIQALNLHFRCDYNFQSHLRKAEERFGVPAEVQAAIPLWQTSTLFDDEQRLVIEYTLATVTGAVSNDPFARVASQFEEMGAIRPEHDFGYASTGAGQ